MAEHLRESDPDSAAIEARVILEHATGRSTTWVYQNPHMPLDSELGRRLAHLVAARRAGEPLAYLLGQREFYGRMYHVDHRVLVPRPETELLVEQALEFARHRASVHMPVRRILDVGTGSGVLAISLALALPNAFVVGVDRSGDALEVARHNRQRYAVDSRVELVQADLLDGISGPFDIVVANLPYVPTMEVECAQPEVRREPRLALDGGPDGLAVVRRFLKEAGSHLSSAGALFLEIGWDQGVAMIECARRHLHDRIIALHQDLEGRDRVVAIAPVPLLASSMRRDS